ncbi:sn-glycerol 3-phosphate transport system permease protein/lactose/L-arabinose transport system permease protein [Kribbella aluminosa]|uniref:Sn-glycerol 3-phosphate transport system permease protein/lactose/L-arabinose transport system permease protein n=1 Tax=Kribbella aluminosa TaxID=416017 RepID=A0ABS4UJU7_9ACTN|nr:sugar ABC transporter permease [Kribbella aluminosa]MBP2351932.1 sn-glycerol 3-phosphate transport system permease protein/lactose/L-arabinose transport system permease protein [Kribbella aluminosa]
MLDTSTQPAGQVTQVTGPSRRTRRRGPKVTDQVPRHLRAHLTAYLMIAPMVVLLGIFVIWPLVYAFYLSFFEMSFYKDAKFVGFDFYQYVLTDPDFYASLWVGLKLAVMVVPTVLVLALLLASFIATLSKRLAAFMKTTVYVPAVVSSVVAAIIFVFIYQDEGVANWFIGLFGHGPVAWLNTAATALPAVAIPAIWLGFGVSTLIMLAGILDIPESYFESARLDGANFWQRTRYITIPSLRNVILFLLVTGLTLTIQEFQLPLVMTNGGPVSATNTPNLYIFNSFRDGTPYATSYSLTAALLLFVVIGTISIIIFRVVSSEKSSDA